MAQVKINKYGDRYIEGFVTLSINGYLETNDTRTEISDEEAIGLLERELDELSGCNDGSELLANADPQLIK